MIRGLYTAATGMNAMQSQIDVTANNIANINTHGFKKSRAEFQDLMYESMNYTAGRTSSTTLNPTGIEVGLGTRLSGIQKNFNEGDLETTGNSLDLVIAGKGFFKITLPNGESGYTRNGAFKLSEDGTLENSQGYPVDPEIVIPSNIKKITFGIDGTVTGVDGDGKNVDIGQITITDFINPAGLSAQGDSIFIETEASGAPFEGEPNTEQFGKLQQGFLEKSNVKLVNEMVNLITAQRAYEANSKAITTSDGMLSTINDLKR